MSKNIVIQLKESLNIENIHDLYIELQEALNKKNPVDLDASAIKKIDTASIQLLVKSMNDAKIQNMHFKIINPSEDLKHIAKIMGLTESLNI